MNRTIDTRGEALWIALVAAAAVLGSLGFACAMPFAAVATVAAVRMRAGAGLTTVLLSFTCNQAIGFGVHGYPLTAGTFGWGLAIGAASIAALLVARTTASVATGLASVVFAFVASFVAYEAVLLAATVPLGSGTGAFTPAIVLRIATINAVALAGLMTLYRVALSMGLPVPGKAAHA